jgi:hypothetical protein
MKKNFTLFLASLFSLSVFGQSSALNFDGADDYISVPETPGILTGSNITFEAWIRPTAIDRTHPLVNKGTSGNYFMVYLMADSDPFMSMPPQLNIFAYNGSANGQVFYTLPTSWINQWHHVAATFNGSTLALYVDGVVVGSTPFGGSIPVSGQGFTLGSHPGYEFFNGTMDEVRIWNTARTQAQIQAAMNTEIMPGTANLVAYYKFNQGTINGNNTAITIATDIATAPHNGTLAGFTLNGSTSNFTTGYSSLVTLAVNEASLTATKKDGAVQLSWKGTIATANTAFEIERSENGSRFAKIGTVNFVAGSSEKAYAFTDAQPAAVNYYRIKSAGSNGQFNYSKTVMVSLGRTTIGLHAYPNPVAHTLQLQLDAPKGKVDVTIKDVSGRTIQSLQLNSSGTTVYTSLDVSRLQKGVYMLQANADAVAFIKE